MRRVTLGLIPLEGDAADARVGAFVAALSRAFDTSVEVHKAADYRALVAALEQGLVHLAWLPPLAAARAVRAGSIAPVAINVRNGATSYMTGLITKKDSPIATLADLRGVKVGWVDRESASGYVVIRASLRQLGVSLVDAFAEELFLRSHAEVARAIQTGRVDVGATCFNFTGDSAKIARSGYTGEGGLSLDDVTILAYTGPIPADVFAVHSSLLRPMRVKLEASLLEAGARGPLYEAARALAHSDGFARPTPRHLEMLETLFETVVAPDVPPSKRPPPL
jgi:phosphonate transport system substrate-binding protein